MLDSGIEVEGFLVSDDKFDENKEKTLLRPLYRLAEIVDQNDALVIVALNSKNTEDVRNALKDIGMPNVVYLSDLKNNIEHVCFDMIATHRITPMRFFQSDRTLKRINVITDSINENLLLGGVATALIVATKFANKYGYLLRIITREAKIDPEPYKTVLKMNNIPLCENTVFASDFAEEYFVLDVGEEDIFLATSWWSAQVIRSMFKKRRFFYIIQEVETFFYPHGVDHYLCSCIMRDENINFIINSHYLRDYFKIYEKNIVDNGICFEPAFSRDVYYAKEFKEKEKHRLFFYARPNNPRNMYRYGVYLINRAIESGLLTDEKWEIYFAGAEIPEMKLDLELPIHFMGQMSWKEYAAFLRNVDLAISLMYTPHPSYPPYDVACSGGVVVSNKCFNKEKMDECNNIILGDLEETEFLKALQNGIELATNLKQREQNYENSKIKRDWDETLEPVMKFMGERI